MSKVEIVSQERFEINPKLKAMYGSYENYKAQQLKSQSLYTYAQDNPSESFYDMRMQAYDKHNKTSEKLIAQYKALQAQYEAALKQQSAVETALSSKYSVSSTKDLTLALNENNSLVDSSLFNKSTKNVNATYQAFIAALQTANEHTHRIV